MSEGAEQPSKRLGYAVVWSLVLLVSLPLCYLLSLGPAFGMAERGWISRATKDAYVSPVRAIFRDNPKSIIVDILNTYISLWLPLAPAPLPPR